MSDERTVMKGLVEAVTNLTVGLSNAERRAQRRHEETMGALVEVFAIPKANGRDREIIVEATEHQRGDEISATFHILGRDVPVSGKALWSATKRIVWFVAVAGTGGLAKWAHEIWWVHR
jgi:hypothetical protein